MVSASPSDSMRAAILIPHNLKANIVPHCLVHPTLPVNTYKFAQGHTHSYAHVHSFTRLEIKIQLGQAFTIAEPSLAQYCLMKCLNI